MMKENEAMEDDKLKELLDAVAGGFEFIWGQLSAEGDKTGGKTDIVNPWGRMSNFL